MDDTNLNDLLSDETAMQLATEQAIKEQRDRTKSLSLDEQWAQLNGYSVHTANQSANQPLPHQIQPLEVYKASELYGLELEHTPMVVPDMIPIGLTVLAGAPKRGKSWLALSLALAVAGGTLFLDRQCRQGDVLYLDLESRKYRVQDRLSKLITGPAPNSLYIAHDASTLGGDLYEQLNNWCASVAKPTLIIIDTLGRVKASGKKSSENAYESDTRMFGALQKWAFDHRLALLVVHHLRKSKESDDWFDRISGSIGLVGTADAVLGLSGERGNQVSKFAVSGRDIDGDYELAIKFDNGRWTLVSESGESYEEDSAFRNSPTIRGIYRIMQFQPEWQGTANDLHEAIVDATGEPLPVTPQEMQRELITYTQKLYDNYAILAGQKRPDGGRRRVIFLRNMAAINAPKEWIDP